MSAKNNDTHCSKKKRSIARVLKLKTLYLWATGDVPDIASLSFFFLCKRICKKKGQRFLCQYEKDVTKSLVQLFSLSCEPSVFQELKREQSSDLRWLRLFYWRTTLAHVCVNKPNDLSFSGLLNCVILPCLAVSQLNKITDRKTRSRGRRSLPCFSLDSRNLFSRLL